MDKTTKIIVAVVFAVVIVGIAYAVIQNQIEESQPPYAQITGVSYNTVTANYWVSFEFDHIHGEKTISFYHHGVKIYDYLLTTQSGQRTVQIASSDELNINNITFVIG